jgi:hypothetical protein
VDGGEGGGEVVEDRCERSAFLTDREGDKLHPSTVFSEGRDEGECLSVFFASFVDSPNPGFFLSPVQSRIAKLPLCP